MNGELAQLKEAQARSGGYVAFGVRQAAVVCAAWLSVAAVGCGGGSANEEPPAKDDRRERSTPAVPRAAESVEEAATAVIQASRRRDCRRFADRVHGLPGRPARDLCDAMKRSGDLALLSKWDGSVSSYGSAAVGEIGSPTRTVFAVLALDRDGRFKFLTLLEPAGPPLSDTQAKNVVEHGTEALRRDDCAAFHQSFLLFDREQTPSEVCSLGGVRVLRRLLRRDRSASFHRFGGNGFIALYGIGIESDEFFTVVLVSAEQGYLWASVAQAR